MGNRHANRAVRQFKRCFDSDAFNEIQWLAVLVKLQKIDELQAIFQSHDDKAAIQTKIDLAIELARGPGFNFTGHGISRNLASRRDRGAGIGFRVAASLLW